MRRQSKPTICINPLHVIFSRPPGEWNKAIKMMQQNVLGLTGTQWCHHQKVAKADMQQHQTLHDDHQASHADQQPPRMRGMMVNTAVGDMKHSKGHHHCSTLTPVADVEIDAYATPNPRRPGRCPNNSVKLAPQPTSLRRTPERTCERASVVFH